MLWTFYTMYTRERTRLFWNTLIINYRSGDIVSTLEWREDRMLLNQKGKDSWKSTELYSLNYLSTWRYNRFDPLIEFRKSCYTPEMKISFMSSLRILFWFRNPVGSRPPYTLKGIENTCNYYLIALQYSLVTWHARNETKNPSKMEKKK